MTTDRTLSVLLACGCVVALGVSAATMDDAVSTSPDDAVDVDSRLLPVGTDTVSELKQAVVPPDDPPDAAERSNSRSDSSQQQSQSSASQQQSQQDSSSKKEQKSPKTNWLDWLLAHLLELLALLAVLLATVLAGVYAHRNRERLLAALDDLLVRLGLRTPAADDDDATEWVPTLPNGVARAWFEMVRRLDLARDRSRTPNEYAAAAVADGHDPELVREVTESFCAVRYGGHPVTDDLESSMRDAVDRLKRRSGSDGEANSTDDTGSEGGSWN